MSNLNNHFADPLMGNGERGTRKMENKRDTLMERDLASNNITNIKNENCCNDEEGRRLKETRETSRSVGLLPPGLLIDLRRGNVRYIHTELQILGSTVNFVEGKSKEIKLCSGKRVVRTW